MEQVLPGDDPDDPLADPITESNDLKDAGRGAEAHRILMELCRSDLRCLDAHAHLGNFVFDHRPGEAIRHYEVGLRIGELSLGERFEGCCPGATSTTAPFCAACMAMACVSGDWGASPRRDASSERMLWLNPSDNQGVRFLLQDVGAGKAWEENREDR